MKIVAVESIGMKPVQEQAFRKHFEDQGHEFVFYPDRNEKNEVLAERMKDAEIVIISNIRLEKSVLEQCPKLKLLAVAFTGLDHIDLEYCKSRGIEVMNAAGYATVAVAELAIGLMLDVYRKVTELDATTRRGGVRGSFLGRELSGKCVGIIGTGAIGTHTARLAKAFGCKVVAWSRTQKPEVAALGIEYVSLEELLRVSDIVSLHVPLTAETRHLLDAEKLALCKSGAVIINTARGAVVDNAAMAKLLTEGKLGGAGVDVFESEPPVAADHPLLNAPNVVLTPHVGYASYESFAARIDIVRDNIDRWLKEL